MAVSGLGRRKPQVVSAWVGHFRLHPGGEATHLPLSRPFCRAESATSFKAISG